LRRFDAPYLRKSRRARFLRSVLPCAMQLYCHAGRWVCADAKLTPRPWSVLVSDWIWHISNREAAPKGSGQPSIDGLMAKAFTKRQTRTDIFQFRDEMIHWYSIDTLSRRESQNASRRVPPPVPNFRAIASCGSRSAFILFQGEISDATSNSPLDGSGAPARRKATRRHSNSTGLAGGWI